MIVIIVFSPLPNPYFTDIISSINQINHLHQQILKLVLSTLPNFLPLFLFSPRAENSLPITIPPRCIYDKFTTPPLQNAFTRHICMDPKCTYVCAYILVLGGQNPPSKIDEDKRESDRVPERPPCGLSPPHKRR